MRELVSKCLVDIGFSDIYTEICNNFSDFDGRMNVKKRDVERVLESIDWNLNFASIDKTFFEDYKIEDTKIRFCFNYKRGLIECFYVIQKVTNESISDRFNGIAEIENSSFQNSVKFNIPIAASITDLETIIINIRELNSKFLSELKSKLKV